MRVLLTVSSVLFAIGIRRLPGADLDVEAFKSQLKKRGPRDVVGLLQSFIQGSGTGKWTENINVEITQVITNLTQDIVGTLTHENTQFQNAVVSQHMNEFAYWIDARKAAESAAEAVESQLYDDVLAEKGTAESFYSLVDVWKGKMLAIAVPCKGQADHMDQTISVSPQGQFECDFSEKDALLESHCGSSFDRYESNVSSEVAALNETLTEERGYYDDFASACSSNIATANGAYQDTKNAYDAWVANRMKVQATYNQRRQIVCPQATSCRSSSAECYGGQTPCIRGLSNFLVEELRSGSTVFDDRAAVLETNASNSLDDRNYELDSMNIVNCLLSKISTFITGSADSGTAIEQLVSVCSNRQTGLWVWKDYEIHHVTSSTKFTFPDSINSLEDCMVTSVDSFANKGDVTPYGPADARPDDVSGTTYESLINVVDGTPAESVWSTEKTGNVHVGNSNKISMFSSRGIPEKLNGAVDGAALWSGSTFAAQTSTEVCDKYFYPDGEPAAYYSRTGFDCMDALVGQAPSLWVGNLLELDHVLGEVPVPDAYVSRTNNAGNLRAFDSSGITDCQQSPL